MSVEAKARKLLAEGRVRVIEAGHGHPGRARVQGDHAVYEIVFHGGYVACPCPAWKRRCSHAVAVERVVEAGS